MSFMPARIADPWRHLHDLRGNRLASAPSPSLDHQQKELVMLTRHPEFLRTVLIADAVASGATGALMIAGAGFLSGLLSLPGALLFEAGLLLVPYVLFVLWTATRRTIPVTPVRLIIACNMLWPLGSLVLL